MMSSKAERSVSPASNLGLRVATAVFLVLLAPREPRSENDQGPVVFCYDPQRAIVQSMLSGECRGKVVDAAEAEAIRSSRRSRLIQRLNKGNPAAIPGKRLAGVGTGFFVDTDGSILTNDHVIRDCPAIFVRASNLGEQEARVLARKPSKDLALLRSDLIPTEIARFTVAALGSGGKVAAIGHPNQGLPTLRPFVTRGTLSGEKVLAPGLEVAEVKADVRPGNSGGPLLDTATGAVLGVVFAKVNTPKVYEKTGNLVRYVGYVIPANDALVFLRANGIGYRLFDPKKKTEAGDLIDRAKAYVARIECWK